MLSLLLTHISLFMVFLAALVGFIIGTLWYSPFIMGDRWARLVGVPMNRNVNILPLMLGAFGISLAHAYGLAWFLENTHALHLVDAITVVLMMSVLFIGSHMMSGILWERRSPELAFINFGSTLLCYLSMALLFVYVAA